MRKGQPAPFDGYILTPSRSAELVASVEGCDAWIERERKYLTDTSSTQIKYLTRICAIEKRALSNQLDMVRMRAEELAKREQSVWRQEELWFGIGAVSGILSVLLGAWAISQVAK